MKKFWKWQNSVSSSDQELIIDGIISSETWWGDEVTPALFREELAKHKGDAITVVINSDGGDVFAGLAIYNALRESDKKVTVRVDGIAASIASVIAMAGDEIIMSLGSMMMVHRPSVSTIGDAEDMEKAIEILLAIEEGIVSIYTERTGQTEDRVREMMEDETWLTAEKAVELGFADEVSGFKLETLAVEAENKTRLAFSMQATKQAFESFVAKIKEEEETEKKVESESEKIEKEEAQKEQEETERINLKEKEKMPEEEEKKTIATDLAIEPAKQARVEVKPKLQSYLNSKTAENDFGMILIKNAGKEASEVKNAWHRHVEGVTGYKITNEVTNPEKFLPCTVATDIQDAFDAGGPIWNRAIKTGLDVYNAMWDTETDVDDEDGRARGYNRAETASKAEQKLTFDSRVLRPKFVYKYLTLGKETIKEQRSTGALVRFVLAELPRRIIRELERAIVTGDGRATGSDYKIDSFVSVKADAAADNFFATTYTPLPAETRYEALVRARSLIRANGEKILVSKPGYITEVILEKNSSDGFLFPPGVDMGRMLGFSEVVEPDWMESDSDNDAYIIAMNGYKTVGDNSIESYTNFALKTNLQEYLQELWAGGGLTQRKSAVAIASDES